MFHSKITVYILILIRYFTRGYKMREKLSQGLKIGKGLNIIINFVSWKLNQKEHLFFKLRKMSLLIKRGAKF